MSGNSKPIQKFDLQDLNQYMRPRLEEMERTTKGQLRITGVFLSEIFKQYCVDKNYFNNAEEVFPLYYNFYNTDIKPVMRQFIYDFYKHKKPAKADGHDTLVHISGSSTAVGKTTYLNTLGAELQKLMGVLDEYPIIHDEDPRLKFVLKMDMKLVSVFICRDVHISAKAYEDRMRDEQRDRTYKPLTAHQEAVTFVNNSITRTQWFLNFVKKRLETCPEWKPKIYRNLHGDPLSPNLPKKEDYFKPMSLDELGSYLEDLKKNQLDHIEKCRKVFCQRIIPPHRKYRIIPFPPVSIGRENTPSDLDSCAAFFHHRTNLQIHNSLKQKGCFNESKALRKESFRKAHLDNKKNYAFFAKSVLMRTDSGLYSKHNQTTEGSSSFAKESRRTFITFS